MLELSVSPIFSAIPAAKDEARFVNAFYRQNISALHGCEISPEEWKEILSFDDDDEQNFLILKGCMPIAWLRINGLSGNNSDTAWISMLAVSDRHHRCGAGSFSVKFAEGYARRLGFKKMAIHTTYDNIPAQNLYKKCGYSLAGQEESTASDGTETVEYTFAKEL